MAAIVDGFLEGMIFLGILIAIGYFQRAMRQEVTITEQILVACMGFGVFLLVHGFLLASRGQTVGKLLTGIRIVDYESNELLPFLKLVSLRYLPLRLVAMIPVVGGILVLLDVLLIFGPERRCIHDLIAGTKVVQN